MHDEDETVVVAGERSPLAEDLGNKCLVLIYGGDLGRRYPMTGDVTVGREQDNSITLDLQSVSRRHARFFEIGDDYYVDDLGSTNGTRVNGVPVTERLRLRSGDLVQVGTAILKFLCGDLEALYHEEIYRVTINDGLTQIHNKRYLVDFLEREVSRSRRHGRELSLILFDIDFFKGLNDTYGHLAGDHILKELAGLISGRMRQEAVFARYGGEEFAIVLPETSRVDAAFFAERIRSLVEENVFEYDGECIRTTISIGVAEFEKWMEATELLKVVDDRLYDAKHRGRNCVIAG